ncbi:MAG: NUDIX hydrolase [Solirubrobacteraceae bacterium]
MSVADASDSNAAGTTGNPAEVHAAGGVILRDGLVAVVHRPHRDDWSLPKGKLDPGETFEQAAVRETLEETGLRVELGPELPEVRYRDHRNRPKLVRYWLLLLTGGEFVANDEVDELRWLAPDEAKPLLTYPADRRLVDEAVALAGP